MEFFDNHKALFGTAFGMFVGLTIIVAIIPAIKNQNNNSPLPTAVPLSDEAVLGKQVYIANGCVACHTQQVRNIDMDKMWGDRPGIPADYAGIKRTDFWRNTATLMGTERTGPDLTNIGKRQPSVAWHLTHLYQPRAVVDRSIMPAYPWLFEVKDVIAETDVEVSVPEAYRQGLNGKIVARKEALQLVAYLQSLKQPLLPVEIQPLDFLYKKEKAEKNVVDAIDVKLDGKALYVTNCAACHQTNGEGLPGAFPPLKGSSIINGDNLDVIVSIIMQGYDARPEFAVMNAVGQDNNLTPEEVTAIINFEKTNWGNKAKTVSVEDVKKIIESNNLTSKK